MTNRLTLDYGMRFTHQTPQYDQFDQESNFFPNQFTAANAQVLYVAGAANGATMCSGNTRNAKNPLTGQIITGGGAANSQVLIGTPIPGMGNPLNGIVQAGHGIANTNYLWPALVFATAVRVCVRRDREIRLGDPRRLRPVLRPPRREHGILDAGQVHRSRHDDQNLYYGQLQTLGTGGLSPLPVADRWSPSNTTRRSRRPSSGMSVSRNRCPARWSSMCPMWATTRITALGARREERTQLDEPGALRHGLSAAVSGPDARRVDAFRARRLTRRICSGRTRASARSRQNTTKFHDTYHSIQLSVNRRYRNGFSSVANYTRGISAQGQHRADPAVHATRTACSARSDEAAYEELN